MLAELEIENIALVEKAEFCFSQGLNILTGETGAGKSLVVDSLNFLLGSVARDKILRQSAETGSVSAHFVDISPEVKQYLDSLGLSEESSDELIVSRDIKQNGRSVCRVNSHLVTVAVLRELGKYLIDLHSQHQQYALLKPASHLKILDNYIISSNVDSELEKEPESNFACIYNIYKKVYKELQDKQAELDNSTKDERNRIREIDLLKYELAAIKEVSPEPNEDEELEEKIKILSAASDLQSGTYRAHEILDGEGGVGELLADVVESLRSLESKDKSLGEYHKRLKEAMFIVSDCARDLSSYSDNVLLDVGQMDSLQERLEDLRKLLRKYGPTLEDVFENERTNKQKLHTLENQSARNDELEHEIVKLTKVQSELLQAISKVRKDASLHLAGEVTAELAKVGMPLCKFEVSFTDNPCPGPEGGENVEFLISPNPGEGLKPLAKVASGGELSRIMLALLSVFSKYQAVSTLIFDEIDAGLGGRGAEAVAKRLQELSQRCQIVCVTHLAILAVCGVNHHHLQKNVSQGRTSTTAIQLKGEDRVLEIARMLSGDASIDESMNHARGLLMSSKPQ